MIYLIVLCLGAFLLVNLYIAQLDWIAPNVIFCIVFLLSALICAVVTPIYSLEFHYQTLIVLMMGCVMFTFIAMLSRRVKLKKHLNDTQRIVTTQPIQVWNAITIMMLVLLVFYAFAVLQYVRQVAIALGVRGSMIDFIGRYNKYVKSNLNDLNVRKSWLYSELDVPCRCFEYIILYVFLYNFIVHKKTNPYQLAYIFGYFVVSFFTGNRSPAFRIITAAIIYAVFFINAKRAKKRMSTKTLFRVALLLVAIFFLLMISRNWVGRNVKSRSITYYMFAYLGGPLSNLDTYLQGTIIQSELWGEQTFGYLINEIGSMLGIAAFRYRLDLPYITGVAGQYFGNVYTTFYQFLHDFGYLGVLPLTAIIALYYCVTYKRISDYSAIRYDDLPLSIVVYGYLFNDLIMLMFSNRFYENAFRISFVKSVIYFILIKILLSARMEHAKLRFRIPGIRSLR